jgi:SSS family solute:Na+ symporter
MAARQFLPDADPASIYGIVCKTLLPGGALGLIIAAMFSATMSSLSGEYNVLASVLTNDVYKRLIDRAASERRLVLVGRLTTLLIGCLPLGVALFVAANRGNTLLFQKMVTVFSIAAPPIAIPMLAGLVWRRASNVGAIAAFLCGIIMGLTLYFLIGAEKVNPARVLTLVGFSAQSKAPEILLTLSTVLTTLVVLIPVSLLVPARGEERRRKDEFVVKLQTPVPPADLADRTAVPSPWGAVGVSVMATAVLLLGVQPWMGWNAGSKTNLIIGIGLLAAGLLMVRQSRRGRRPAETQARQTAEVSA